MGERVVLCLFLLFLSCECFGSPARARRQAAASNYAILFTPFDNLSLLMDLQHSYITVKNSELHTCYYISILSSRHSALGLAVHVYKQGVSSLHAEFVEQRVPWSWVLHNMPGSEFSFCTSNDRHVLLQSPDQPPEGQTPGDQPPGGQPSGDKPPEGQPPDQSHGDNAPVTPRTQQKVSRPPGSMDNPPVG